MTLTFIVLACHMNVSVPRDPDDKNCKIFKEEILEEGVQQLTPMTCIMQSPVMIVKFEEQHPGWQARKWSCKYLVKEQDV